MICLPVDWLAKSWAGAVDLVILQILPEAEAPLLWLGLGLLEAVEAVVRLEEAGAALVPLLWRLRDPAALLPPDPLEGVPGEGARPRARPGLGPGLGAAAEAGHGGGSPAAAGLGPELAVLAVGAVQTRLVPSTPPGGNSN